MKKVLIIVDYDPTAQYVAETGFSIAKSMKAKVILLHVISAPDYYFLKKDSPVLGFSVFPNKNSLRTDDGNSLKKACMYYLNLFKLYLGDKTIQTHVEAGSYAEAILKTAASFKVGLIVIASHSRKWMEIKGSEYIPEKIVKNTYVPVFIVPTRIELTPLINQEIISEISELSLQKEYQS